MATPKNLKTLLAFDPASVHYKAYTLKLPLEVIAYMKAKAKREGTTVSALFRKALATSLDTPEPKA